MLTLSKCFSALVASGNGQKCNELRSKVNSYLLQKDHSTGYLKVILFKYYKEQYPDIVKSISRDLQFIIEDVVLTVDDIYFGNNLKQKEVD